MPTQNVNLSTQQAYFVRRNVDGGRFQSASEVVRAGLRLLEDQQRLERAKLASLKRLARQGFEQIERGEQAEVDPERVEEFLDQITRESKTRPARPRRRASRRA